ncbi:MAG: hypothetical protein RMY28_009715 [Nostoc sp. ChiSLP01]|nr:hypothetical protein [Nostoc sp. CmiSLP01]MDZ8285169.1 hypothetical protein [Nostoc sp. ChiSLP01]
MSVDTLKVVLKPELIQAATPLILGLVGGIIGIFVMVSPRLSDAKAAAGFGLAGTAIAGASGLAQSTRKSED